MNKLFVPYELAAMAKQKGFSDPCFAKFFYPEVPENRFRYNTQGTPMNYNSEDCGRFISAPLYQQLVDWFREKHFINIETTFDFITFDVVIYDFKNNNVVNIVSSLSDKSQHCFTDWYSALDAAIEQAFKIIQP